MTQRCYNSPEKANIGGERNRDSFRELLRGLPSLPPLLIFMRGLVQERESIKTPGQSELCRHSVYLPVRPGSRQANLFCSPLFSGPNPPFFTGLLTVLYLGTAL